MRNPALPSPTSEPIRLEQPVTRRIWRALAAVGLLSGLVNLLYLTGSLFMLQVYDRVLPSRSVPTLIGLGILVILLFAFQAFFDVMRGRLLVRIAASIDRALGRRLFNAIMEAPLRTQARSDGLQPVRDLDQVRSFLSGLGPAALFDLPWIPLYVLLCFAFHVWIGVAVVIGAAVLVALTLSAELLTKRPSRSAGASAVSRNALAEAGRRNAEVVRAMGIAPRLADRWTDLSEAHVDTNRRLADVSGGLGSVTKVVRLLLQSLVLGVGALLVIQGETTGGIMIASSILVARALAPVELAIANWKGFVAARQSWRRLTDFLAQHPERSFSVSLPAPRNTLTVEGLSVTAPGGSRLLVQDASFRLQCGQGLGVVGASGSGKSSLIRALVGVWAPLRGKVRLDDAAIEQWSPAVLGRHIGYLPQDVELFAGTVAQNIARFASDATSEDIVAAAEAAGVHALICRLPDGYDTQLGEGGLALSAGQRQRVALARALFGNPFLVVLDEPNSNLDADGEDALRRAIMGVRARGGIVVIVAHRPAALAAVDHALLMADGRIRMFGRREEVLERLAQTPAAAARSANAITAGSAGSRTAGLRVVADQAERAQP